MVRLATIAVALTLMAGGAAAQPGQAPPRDRPNLQTPSTGTAAIRGRIVDAQTGSPVARARVRLNRIGQGPLSAGSQAPVTTDESGGFAFSGLAAGSYFVFADKSTYLSSRYPDGGQTVRAASRTLSAADGQEIDITIPLYHGSAIVGRVVDAYSDPVEGAMVQAIRIPRVGRARPQFRAAGSSNDIGQFRLSRLEPGRYLLLVTPRRMPMFVPPGQEAVASASEPEPVPTFYPGVLSIDDAQPIGIERGTTVDVADVTLVDGAVATVSGTLIDSSGQPVTRGGTVIARPTGKVPLPGPMMGAGTGPVRPDGTFQVKLAAGEYELEGRTAPSPPNRGRPAGDDEAGALRLTVAGDISGVTIQVGRGATVTGRILFDGTSAPPSPPSAPNGPGVPFVMAPPNNDGGCRATPPEVAADWRFTLSNLFGTCSVRAFGNVGPWSIKSVTYQGRDLIDEPITFGQGQEIKDVEVVLTDKRTAVTFHVTDEQGAATRDYVGLLFAADKRKWTDQTGRYRRTLVPQPNPPPASSGSGTPGPVAGPTAAAVLNFGGAAGPGGPVMVNGPGATTETLVGLPAGEYYAIAVDDVDQDGLTDPDFLEQLSRSAARIRLTDDGPASVTLRRLSLSR